MNQNQNQSSSHTSSTILTTLFVVSCITSIFTTNAFSFHFCSNSISFVKSSSSSSHCHYNRIKKRSYDHQHHRHHRMSQLRMSSVGGGSGGNDNNIGGGKGENGNLDDWLDPRKSLSESENLKRARAQMSEESLPISFDVSSGESGNSRASNDSMNIDNNDEIDIQEEEEQEGEDDINETIQVDYQQLDQTKQNSGKMELLRSNSTTTNQLMTSNPYLQVVAKLSPSELISKFTSTAHPRVQDAVRSTVLGLIGTLPKMAFETTTITTGERLASLMFQLQLTGYMLKNADYRLSLSQSLGVTSNNVNSSNNGQSQFLLEGDLDYDDDEDDEGRLSDGKVRGTIKISYGSKSDAEKDESGDDEDTISSAMPTMEVEVDAAAYMAELRNEVAKLREDLVTTRKAKEDEIRKDLLLYIRTLPQKELKSLTSTLSDDVLDAMKGLVNVVMAGIGEGQIGPDTVTEQSGEAMAQLCMWQLVVGYNLRELEVREEMKNTLRSGSLEFGSNNNSNNSNDNSSDKRDEGSIDFDKGGFE